MPAINVPHLTTALQGPLHALERHLLNRQLDIERWLRYQWQSVEAPIYGSFDLRNAGYKLAPVDMNIFPAGFNNLNSDFIPLCIQAVQSAIDKTFPHCNRIMIIPESHTRNLLYFESVFVLQDILISAGFDVRIGSLNPDISQATTINLPSGKQVVLEPLKRFGDKIGLEEFIPCLIWLNNDLSDGLPLILQNLKQKILPPMELGWYNRLKSVHFKHYDSVCLEFANVIEIDPWLINPLFSHCDGIDFNSVTPQSCLMEKAQELFGAIAKKYEEYGIQQKPYIVIKADSGTYGMAVMIIKNLDEIVSLNRKQRSKMMASKGGRPVTKVILQEGVYSLETWDNSVAEPVVYTMGQHVVGGFYRVHKDRAFDENLNAPGMHFEALHFVKSCNYPGKNNCEEKHNRFYAYGVIARLSLLAAAREQREYTA